MSDPKPEPLVRRLRRAAIAWSTTNIVSPDPGMLVALLIEAADHIDELNDDEEEDEDSRC